MKFAVLVVFAMLLGCDAEEEICPGLAREMFPGEKVLGVSVSDQMVVIRFQEVDEGQAARALICSNNSGSWKLVPTGIMEIDPKPAEKGGAP